MNKIHYNLIVSGVLIWNKWRQENPAIVPDLRWVDLHEADLHEADLHEADLYEADLYEASLIGASLYGANLHGANLRGASLIKTNLHGADLHGADLSEANLREASLSGADLSEAKGIVQLLWAGFTILIWQREGVKYAKIGCREKTVSDWLLLSDDKAILLGAKSEHLIGYRLVMEFATAFLFDE
jgi:uncharacterized protein YjbI with pentapeptide repeats